MGRASATWRGEVSEVGTFSADKVSGGVTLVGTEAEAVLVVGRVEVGVEGLDLAESDLNHEPGLAQRQRSVSRSGSEAGVG